MKLRSVEISKKLVPEFNGNRELPPGEQVVIHFGRIPGTAEVGNYKSFKFDQKGGAELVYNDQVLVSAFVERVENLELEINGKPQRVKTGPELAAANNPALTDLFSEIRDHLFPDNEELSEGESEA